MEEDIREVVLGVLSLDHVTESSLVTINLLLSEYSVHSSLFLHMLIEMFFLFAVLGLDFI